MSKIVIMSVMLAAPKILTDLLNDVKGEDPNLAKVIEELDTLPLINECVENVVVRLAEKSDIQLVREIKDYYGKTTTKFNDREFTICMKTNKLPNGLGVIINKDGAIEFAGDNYRSDWREEIERLQKLFAELFTQEAVKIVLNVLGYNLNFKHGEKINQETGEKQQTIHIEGVKQ